MTSAASRLALVAGSRCCFALPASAASQLNTGGSGGAYDASFCPARGRPAQAGAVRLPAARRRAAARENMQRVLADPRQLGYGQLDVFALESRPAEGRRRARHRPPGRRARMRVRRHAQQGHRQLRRAGGLRRQAALHPAAAPARAAPARFQFLRGIDADGLGKAKSRHATRHRPRTPSARRCRPTIR